MTFAYIENVLGFFPNLRVLERSSQPYDILLYQHEGVLSASPTRIGNVSTDQQVLPRFRAFFDLAKERNADLVLTPEYSCPWEVVGNILHDPNRWPREGKLWVIGAESISKQELTQFETTYQSPNLFIAFDQSLFQSTNNFFDPLLYLFVSTQNETLRLNVIIQFKTYHMSVWSGGEVERNNIILGEEIYVIRNATNSIHLISLICSEAMNFPAHMTGQNELAFEWLDRPYLILNPQLNGEPAHPNFTAFRKFVFDSSDKEIIQVNWHAGSRIGPHKMIPGDSARTAIFISSSEVNQDDTSLIKQNHARGLYYFFYGIKNRHAFFCNSHVHAFLIAQPAVSIAHVQAQQARRDGPVLKTAFMIDVQNQFVPSNPSPSDASIDYMNDVGCQNVFVTSANCVLEKERLACLSAGEIARGASEWYKIENLFSIRLDDTTEINRRLTFAEDTVDASIDQRTKYIRAIASLDYIISARKDLFPKSIEVLAQEQLLLGFHQTTDATGKKMIEKEKYKYNLTKSNGDPLTVTVCYLDHPTGADIKKTFGHLQDMFGDNPAMGRVVIFYSRGQNLEVEFDNASGKYTAGYEYNKQSYLNAES